MRSLLMLLALLSLSFAADGEMGWQGLAILAGLCALGVLAILYMLSYLADSHEMRLLALNEIYQVFIALFFIAGFVILDAYLNAQIAGPLAGLFGQEDLIGAAISVSKGVAEYQWEQVSKLTEEVTIPLGSLASMTGICSFLGTSYTYP
ncbi:MAG: hypothetical protein QXH30_02875, partial [Candidatus Bilamarchaeaceae archaeon]